VISAARNSGIYLGDVSYEYEDADKMGEQDIEVPKFPIRNELDESMSFLMGIVERNLKSSRIIYHELLPYLQEFETKIEIKLTKQERSAALAFFRIGHALAWRENLSENGIKGYMHPSIRNALYWLQTDPFVKEQAELLDDLIPNSITLRSEQIFIYIGYFLSQYNLESPQFVMENFSAWERKGLSNT